jgi:peptidoglycan/xylan/chitin deacetylase (PgdA/CDA1 family)
MIGLLTGAGAIGLTTYFSPHVERLRSARALRKLANSRRSLVLTYDDGPSGSVTPELLDLLQSYSARATFFMLGRSVQLYPAVADRILNEGHDVGCHTDQHVNAWKASPWRAIRDIDAGYKSLSAWVSPASMFRPPYGKMTLPTYLAIRRRGASIGWWTIDSGDTRSPLPRPHQVVDTLIKQGGGVVLMHDLDRTRERNEFVIRTTTLLLNEAKREGLTIERLSDLNRAGAPTTIGS